MLPQKRLEHDMIMQHDICQKDVETVYLSPSPFHNAYEETLDLWQYNPTISPTAGLLCDERSLKLYLWEMMKSTLAAKIRAWRSRLHGARITAGDGTPLF